MRVVFFGIVGVVLLGFIGYFFFAGDNRSPVTEEEGMREEKSNKLESLKYVDFSQINSIFRFAAQIPFEFEVESIPSLKSISIYNPNLPGENVREKSQIYISSFEANRFLTLSTVEITQQDETFIKDHDAVLYEITKKPGVPDFIQQPSWRNSKHKALDIRLTKNNPSVFYSFAYNPKLSQEALNGFLDSLAFH